MKIRIVLLLLAIIFGIAAVVGVMIYLNNVKSSIEEEGALFNVVVAVEDIALETRVSDMLDSKTVEIRQVPKKYVIENAMESLEGYEDYVAKTAISKGEQFTVKKLGKIEEIRISFTVPEGFIAVSIPYDEIRGVSNLIKPGDKVNVIGTFTPGQDELVLFNKDLVTQVILEMKESESESEIVTESETPTSDFFDMDAILDEENYIVYPAAKTLLWNVEVLCIGSMKADTSEQNKEGGSVTSGASSKDEDEIKTITLALTPEQAETLVFSEELGKVWLALVPAEGINEEETGGKTYLDILE
ncbi:MAG: hypothetical protein JW997_01430 [Actinobacteria bacterium]|nr:hypothetical protein [Actinomycetota bacterium]